MQLNTLLTGLLLVGIGLLSGVSAAPKPPVNVVIKKPMSPDGTNLEVSLNTFKEYFRQQGLNVQEVEGAGWRIDISGSTGPVFGAPNQIAYTLYITAYDKANSRLICRTTFASSPKVPLSELAQATVEHYINPSEQEKLYSDVEKDRKAFFNAIQRYFYATHSAPVALVVTDTSGPVIEVYSPVIERSRAMKPVAKVQPNIAVTIIGKVSDASKLAMLTLNGKVLDVNADGTFRPVVNMTAAKYDVIFEARDAVGNSRNLSFTLDPELLKSDKAQKDVPIADKRLALVIGNGGYEFVPRLGNPPNDAEAMAKTLLSVGFDMMPTVINGSRKDILNAMNEFKDRLSREKYTVALFYYAGHGVQHNGLNYIIPVEMGLKDDVSTDCVEVQRVINQMEEANTRTNIIILDACRDDPFGGKRTLSGGAGPAAMEAPVGTFIAFATSPGSTAADGGGLNGTYTAALLTHIQTPNISISSMFQNVRNEVLRKTNNKQKPWESTSLTGDFYFRR